MLELLAKILKQILMNMTTKMREVCIKEIEIIMKTTNLAAFKEKIAAIVKKKEKIEQKEIIGEREHLLPNLSN
jgi:ApbE superfamily uncharacterized protein (UPF0280 family)